MVHIAAVITTDEQKASDLIVNMLSDTNDVGDYKIGVSSSEQIEFIKKLDKIKNKSSCLLAVKNSNNDYPLLPLLQDHAFAFEGHIYQTIEPDSLWVANRLGYNPESGIKNIIKENAGAFSITVVKKDRIICGRDKIGTIPLYFGENNSYAAVASNRKMLWKLDLNPEPVLPGTIVRLSENQSQASTVDKLTNPKIHKEPVGKTIETLHNIFSDLSELYVRKIPELAISFSGGIDSTLVAYYLKQAGANLDLICTGINEQKEYEKATLAADELELPLTIEPRTMTELEHALPEIVQSVEEPNLMKISVAAPLYFSAKKADSMGYNHIASGNGSDELFGGYMKYMKNYLKGKNPRKNMFKDVKNSWRNNFDRDTKICRDLGLKLILPFTHPRIIKYGINLSTEYLLPRTMKEPRKVILRKLAYSLGIRDEISERPKKAAQYSSGVDKAIKKIAKKHELKPWEYLNQIYLNTKKIYIEVN